jgi:hypothetical protein
VPTNQKKYSFGSERIPSFFPSNVNGMIVPVAIPSVVSERSC